jgi:hypothetical protein
MACFLEESRHAGRIRNGDDAREIKGALATFMVTISEGRGYGSTPLPIHAVYSGPNWDGVSYITDEDTELLVKWGELWYALYHWGQHPEDNWSGPSYYVVVLVAVKHSKHLCTCTAHIFISAKLL